MRYLIGDTIAVSILIAALFMLVYLLVRKVRRKPLPSGCGMGCCSCMAEGCSKCSLELSESIMSSMNTDLCGQVDRNG